MMITMMMSKATSSACSFCCPKDAGTRVPPFGSAEKTLLTKMKHAKTRGGHPLEHV